jgi:Beta-ketoacyl synthase, N-terminal domain
MRVYVEGAGVLGAGLPDWPTARQVLRGERAYRYQPPPPPNPAVLPAAERRHGAKSVRWAVAVAQEALSGVKLCASEVATVFTSSGGDGETLHHICEALATPEREVSPTRFHNSVHNAAAGYWSIAAGSRCPSTSLCAYDASFAAGLLEAASQVSIERDPVLLVAYDLPYPQPLFAVRPVAEPLAVALLLAPEPCAGTLACWGIALADGAAAAPHAEALAPELLLNPVGCALPLLALLARNPSGPLQVSYLDDCHLVVESLQWR